MDSIPHGSELYKIPLLARRKRLPVLPGQPEGISYGMIWGACPLPANGSCYIVRFEGDTSARILAYVSEFGEVFAASGPITLEPTARPELALVPDERGFSGTIFVRNGSKALEPYSRYRGSFKGVMREVCDTETWNSSRTMGYRAFAASLYLRYCVIDASRLTPVCMPEDEASGPEGRRGTARGGHAPTISLAATPLSEPVQLFEGFNDLALPDAIEAALFRIDGAAKPSGLERFARRLLSTIDLERLRKLTEAAWVSLAYIRGTDSFYLNFSRESITVDDTLFLFGVEAVLNRLCAVEHRFGSVPEGVEASPSEEACSLIDQHMMRGMTSWVGTSIDRTVTRNGWADFAEVSCRPGGEWDTRTRFATLVEELVTIVRLEYEFVCDASNGVLNVRFTAPDGRAMPHELYQLDEGRWVDVDAPQCAAMAAEYAARMVLALAAAAFASKITMRRCTVAVRDLVSGEEERYLFERAGFLASLVPFAKQVDGASLEQQPALKRIGGLKTEAPFEIPDDSMRYTAVAEDDRELPEELRELLMADRIAELEVMETGPDARSERLAELKELVQSDPAQAEQGFIKLIEELEAGCAAEELLSDVPLISRFCQSRVGRVLLPLWEEDRAARIHRVPDALFFARHELETMYFRAGAFDRALEEARCMLDMAGSSTLAHAAVVNVLARLERFDEVIEVAKHGLRVAVDRDSISYLLYRMAFAYWRIGQLDVAMACYRTVPRGETMSEMAQLELGQLLAEMGRAEKPSAEEARKIIEQAGIPVPPSHEAVEQLGSAAVLLTDNGFYALAYECVYVVWLLLGSDELGAVARSLKP